MCVYCCIATCLLPVIDSVRLADVFLKQGAHSVRGLAVEAVTPFTEPCQQTHTLTHTYTHP